LISIAPARAANQLLAALPGDEYQRLSPELERIELAFAATLYEPGAPLRYVYFPVSGIVSILAGRAGQDMLEVAVVGNEGMVGLPVFMGVETARARAVVQAAGTALRLNAAALRRECERGGALFRLLLRYTQSLLTQVTQSAACNRFHLLEARLARWLLMAHDRMDTDEFQLTQEFLSNMLGVRREGVNRAAGRLQRRGLISYSRGHLTIRDRAGLEAVACPCYLIVRQESESVRRDVELSGRATSQLKAV
jgi:CRP-like cAMP-binding protein